MTSASSTRPTATSAAPAPPRSTSCPPPPAPPRLSRSLPQLKGKLNGIALRVPTPNASIVDLVVNVEKKGLTAEEVNAAFKEASEVT